jgi:bis(5'-nucleosyl)-tetraphosphatase (symmetrical)
MTTPAQAPTNAHTFLVGDVQGCYSALRRLLVHAGFDARVDRLVLLGDLVNRGPESLEVLEFAMSLGDACTTILGNHDLHLLALASGVRKPKADDTLQPILQHPRSATFIEWLRHQQLAAVVQGVLCVHAGVLPQWSTSQALSLASELQTVLRATDYSRFLQKMYGNEPTRWTNSLAGAERLRVVVNAFTRLRFCSAEGDMDFATKEGAASAPAGYLPWFNVPKRQSQGTRIAFGHWSTLGLHVNHHIAALDTGCVWGGPLTALRLATSQSPEQLFQVPCSAL